MAQTRRARDIEDGNGSAVILRYYRRGKIDGRRGIVEAPGLAAAAQLARQRQEVAGAHGRSVSVVVRTLLADVRRVDGIAEGIGASCAHLDARAAKGAQTGLAAARIHEAGTRERSPRPIRI